MEILSIIGWALSVVTALFLGKGAIDKLVGTQEMVGNSCYILVRSNSNCIIHECGGSNALVTDGWGKNLHSYYDWSSRTLGTFSKSILIKTLTQKVGVFYFHDIYQYEFE